MTEPVFLKYENACLPRSKFVGVDLVASTFDDVNLRGAVFDNVALVGASFRNVDLADVCIADARLEGMRIDGILVTDLFRAYNINPAKPA